MSDMKENIKIGLMAVIAVTLIANTFMNTGGSSESPKKKPRVAATKTPAPKKNNSSITPDVLPQKEDIKELTPEPPAGPTTSIKFAEMNHDFGTIKQDTENNYVFSFTNTGNEPLIIEKAKGSCGCTVPNYPKEPIAPGATAEIEVTYKPGKQKGNQTKTVTVTANTEPRTTQLKISANVEEI